MGQGLGAAVIAIGLVFRMITTYLSVSLSDLINKERIFMCFVWLPKATIQVYYYLSSMTVLFEFSMKF